jgi:hypothetical protein
LIGELRIFGSDPRWSWIGGVASIGDFLLFKECPILIILWKIDELNPLLGVVERA